MQEYRYTVVVGANSKDEADLVIGDALSMHAELGFDYYIYEE